MDLLLDVTGSAEFNMQDAMANRAKTSKQDQLAPFGLHHVAPRYLDFH